MEPFVALLLGWDHQSKSNIYLIRYFAPRNLFAVSENTSSLAANI